MAFALRQPAARTVSRADRRTPIFRGAAEPRWLWVPGCATPYTDLIGRRTFTRSGGTLDAHDPRLGEAFNTGGLGYAILSDANASSELQGFSYTTRFRLTRTGAIQGLVGTLNTGSTEAFYIAADASQTSTYLADSIQVFVRSNNNLVLQAAVASTLPLNGQWRTLTVRISVNTVDVWIDGVKQTTTYEKQQSPSIFNPFSFPFWIGGVNSRGTMLWQSTAAFSLAYFDNSGSVSDEQCQRLHRQLDRLLLRRSRVVAFTPASGTDVDVTGLAGALTFTGQSGAVEAASDVTGAAGGLTLTGLTGSVDAAVDVSGATGSIALTGQAGSLQADAQPQGATGSITFTGLQGSVEAGSTVNVDVTGQTGSISLTGQTGAVQADADVSGTTGTFTLTGLQGSVDTSNAVHVDVTGTTGSLTFTGQAGAVESSAQPQGQAGAVTLTGLAGSTSTGLSVTGQAGTLTFTGLQGSVDTSTAAHVDVTGQTGAMVFTGILGSIQADAQPQGSAGSLAFTGLQGSVTTSSIAHVDVTGQAGSLAFTGLAGAFGSDIPTPSSRTYTVPAQSRTYIV